MKQFRHHAIMVAMFFTWILPASLIGSVLAMIGGTILLWREQFARRVSLVLVSFAAGSLLAAAILGLIPEAQELVESHTTVGYAIIVGVLVLFLFEKLLNWYHCHDQEVCDYHSFSGSVLFGDGIHNFVDGIVIAGSFLVSVEVGIAATIAIFFHEVPQEIGDFGVLLHAGYSKAKVWWYNFLLALATPLGAIAGYLFFSSIEGYLGLLLAFAAGSFLYISVSDLLPELRHHARLKGGGALHVAAIICGVLAIVAVNLLFPEHE